jgi:hypothetical protein
VGHFKVKCASAESKRVGLMIEYVLAEVVLEDDGSVWTIRGLFLEERPRLGLGAWMHKLVEKLKVIYDEIGCLPAVYDMKLHRMAFTAQNGVDRFMALNYEQCGLESFKAVYKTVTERVEGDSNGK